VKSPGAYKPPSTGSTQHPTLQSTKGLNNKAMTTALDGTFDPTLITSIFDWLSAALGITLPPWLQLLGPAIALILQLAIFL